MRGEYYFSGKCNYDCYFCLRNEIGEKVTTSKLKRFEEWIDYLKKNNVSEITLSSFNCEPTIQKEFKYVVSRLYEEGFELELRTNGSYFNKNMISFINERISVIWFSMQGLSKQAYQNIANVSKVPNFNYIASQLPDVECRASLLVNQYNKDEIVNLINNLNDRFELVQLRKMYKETTDEEYIPEEQAYNQVKQSILSLGIKIQNSRYNEYDYKNKIVSLWEDVLEGESGIKYFPASELITDVGKIIPYLKENNK